MNQLPENNKDHLRISLFGASLDTGNRGVSALASSVITIIRETVPQSQISFHIGHQSSLPQSIVLSGESIPIDIVNHRMSLKSGIRENLVFIFFLAVLQAIIPIKKIKDFIVGSNRYLLTLSRADFVGDIWGGDSFSDIYGLPRFIYLSTPRIITVLLGKKTVFLPQTYGPYHSKITRIIARYLLARAGHVFSRDTHGVEVLKELFQDQASPIPVEVCPDVAMILEPTRPMNLEPKISEFIDHIPQEDETVVGINVSGLMYVDHDISENAFQLKCDYKKVIRDTVTHILDNSGCKILFIPHTYELGRTVEDDLFATKQLLKTLDLENNPRIYCIENEYNQSELKWIIGNVGFFIGSRMHACIAALSQGIPTVGIAYSRKFKGVFDTVGLGNMVVDARDTTDSIALNTITDIFSRRILLKKEIAEPVREAKKQIRTSFTYILKKSCN